MRAGQGEAAVREADTGVSKYKQLDPIRKLLEEHGVVQEGEGGTTDRSEDGGVGAPRPR